MALNPSYKLITSAALLAALFSQTATGQTVQQELATVTVSGKAAPVLDATNADVGGFGLPLAKTPQSITVLGADVLAATMTRSLSQAVKLDASLADSYNTTGYVESLAVRGFVLDQASNFLRNGLATSNFAPIALENKERVEILKGVAGLQAGISAPGGLVNYVTKVPVQGEFNTLVASYDGRGGNKLHVDSNLSWGSAGIRLNLATENLHSPFNNADGHRTLAAAAFAGQLSAQTSIAAELEYHHKRQISVPGLGLLDSDGDGMGDRLPGRLDPRLNLNNQSWSSPFQADSMNVQLALNHRLNADWQARLTVSEHRTRINDYLAFPDGCSNSTTYVYPGLCANGDVDIYDYRSEDEVRRMSAWDARLDGKATAFGLSHRLSLGVSGHIARSDLPPMQAYNYVGTTNIFTPIPLSADPTLSILNSNSRERAVAAYASAASEIAKDVRSFVGLRITDISRQSARSDGSDAVDFSKQISTPWAGLSWSPQADTTLYVSWGQGIELDAVPNRPTQFSNFGATLPALKSEQTELGWKWQAANRLLLTAALFNIDKPFADDLPQADGTLLRVAGGKRARHRGLEFSASGRIDEQLSLQASTTLLDARYVAAIDPTLVGRRVTNVPSSKVSLFADYKLRSIQGLAFNALLTAEQGKRISPDGSLGLPDAWQLDLGLRYQQRWGKQMAQWNLAIENLTDRRYWREAPTQSWGGIYLFPATPRTARASLSIDF